MRPSLEIDPGLFAPSSSRSGTGRHTLPDAPAPLLEAGDRISLGGVADEFFSAGDAAPEPELELELAEPAKVVVRTPEMDARRARLVRVVATVVGCFAGVLALGVVRASASEKAETAVSAPLPARTAPAAKPAPAPKPAPEPVAAPAARPAPEPEPTPAPAPALPRVAARAAATPAATPPPVVAPRPAATLPSVVNFAARSGDPTQTATKVPTASFAPAR